MNEETRPLSVGVSLDSKALFTRGRSRERKYNGFHGRFKSKGRSTNMNRKFEMVCWKCNQKEHTKKDSPTYKGNKK